MGEGGSSKYESRCGLESSEESTVQHWLLATRTSWLPYDDDSRREHQRLLILLYDRGLVQECRNAINHSPEATGYMYVI